MSHLIPTNINSCVKDNPVYPNRTHDLLSRLITGFSANRPFQSKWRIVHRRHNPILANVSSEIRVSDKWKYGVLSLLINISKILKVRTYSIKLWETLQASFKKPSFSTFSCLCSLDTSQTDGRSWILPATWWSCWSECSCGCTPHQPSRQY